MNIDEINRKHLLRADMLYRVSFGLSSKLLKYHNGIIYLEVMFGKKWPNNYYETAMELAYSWRDKNKELAKALGCKVYIIDCRKHPYKKDLYLNTGIVSYDSKQGLLFYDDYLN